MKLEVKKCTKTDKARGKVETGWKKKNNVACYRENPTSLTTSCRLSFPNWKNKFSKKMVQEQATTLELSQKER